MRKLLILVAVAAVLWSGYWLIGKRAAETAIRGWLVARAADGWTAEFAEVRTRGFPNRFDTTVRDIALTDPATGLSWSAPFLQILALSYRPNHVIAVWPDRQTLATPRDRIAIRTDRMQASVVFEAGTALDLDRITAVVDGMRLAAGTGWQADIASARFATRRTAARAFAHDIGLEATDLSVILAPGMAHPLPVGVMTLRIDATLGFDGPWDRAAIEGARPALTGIDLSELRLDAGDLQIRAAGALTVGATGTPDGRIDLTIRNWRELLPLLDEQVPEAFLATAERALVALAEETGTPDTLEAPLSFQGGLVSLGPLPLGPAPRLLPQ